MKERIQAYRPAAAAFLVMMAMSLTSSTMSFFLVPVCEALRISRGSFSAIFSLMTISGALTNPFLGQYAGRKGARNILLISGIWVGIGMFLFSSAGQLWMLYLAAFCMGAFGTNCVALCANVIVQQSYLGAQASAILGTVMAGSGVGGMIFNLIIPSIMTAFGWRQGMQAMGIGWFALLWLAAMLLGRETQALPGNTDRSVGLGMTRGEALRSPKLYLQMVVIIVITACCGIQQQQPSLLNAYGFSAEQVSMLISLQTAVLALGKILQGLLYGKLGIRKGGCLMLIVFAAGFVTMISPHLVYPGLILLAFGFGVYTTLMPLVARRVFGSREYAAIWALIATAGSVGTFIANPVWGTIYDLCGSYTSGLAVAPVLLVIAVMALNRTLTEEP